MFCTRNMFAWMREGRPLTVGLFEDLPGRLVGGTAADTDQPGHIRTTQVTIGSHPQYRPAVSSVRRPDTAISLVDFAMAQTIFTVRQVLRRLGVSYVRANKLVGQLSEAGVLRQYGESTYDRRFTAPDVLAVLLAVLLA